ncbi:MAG: DUF2382 domain-containing protein [Acetobacteraceae bacterium]
MTLRTLMQAGTAKANELFTRLSDTSDSALKTRERLFAELKSELEQHADLEEEHLFPILRKQGDTKDFVIAAIRDNKDLRARLGELDVLPKNDETFLTKLAALRKTFREHARDDKRELLPAVQRALSEEQVQGIVGKMEITLAEADQARHDQAEEKRAAARREREQEEATEEAARFTNAAVASVAEGTREVARTVTEGAERVTERALRATSGTAGRAAATTSAAPSTGLFFWDMMLGMSGAHSSRAVATQEANVPASTSRQVHGNEEVIGLAEEILVVGKRTVNTGTTRIRRYVVETPVEQQVSLFRERVVVERRRPATNKLTGEALTELTIEVVETDEVPVVAKGVQLREEIVVRTERTERVATLRETVRQDEVEIEHVSAPAGRARGYIPETSGRREPPGPLPLSLANDLDPDGHDHHNAKRKPCMFTHASLRVRRPGRFPAGFLLLGPDR